MEHVEEATEGLGPLELGERPCIELDDGPGRVRIGLLALANDRVIERDMVMMRPDDDVLIYTARTAFDGDCTLANLRRMSSALTGTAALINPGAPLDAIMFGCTSGTVALGVGHVQASIASARPGVPCIDPISAAVQAFGALNARRISVLAPYVDDVLQPIVTAMSAQGIETVKRHHLDILKSDDISRVTPQSILRSAFLADCPEAEALFIACTDFRSLEVVEAVEAKIGKPVVTSNQALFWSSLQAAGQPISLAGFGRLLIVENDNQQGNASRDA
ncbi:MAG: maleate cis-trans isomerase family protein [Geminicoccaceae bacterium]